MHTASLSFGLIGVGYWGPHYARLLSSRENLQLRYCCDLLPENREKICQQYFGVQGVEHYQDLLADPGLDGVIVTTPPPSHFEIVKACLQAGKDVLVEKPLALTSMEAKELATIARKTGRILLVGHTYLFHPAVQVMKQIIKSGQLGILYYGLALRIGLSPIRKSVNALWDLATHDLAIMQDLFGNPLEVLCTGESYLQADREDFVNVTLRYSHKFTISLQASWFCPEKVRKITLVGSKGMLVFDDLKAVENVMLYKCPLDFSKLNANPAIVDHQQIRTVEASQILPVEMTEPLQNQVAHFIDSVRTRTMPQSNGEKGTQIVTILEAAEKSLKQNGQWVKIP